MNRDKFFSICTSSLLWSEESCIWSASHTVWNLWRRISIRKNMQGMVLTLPEVVISEWRTDNGQESQKSSKMLSCKHQYWMKIHVKHFQNWRKSWMLLERCVTKRLRAMDKIQKENQIDSFTWQRAITCCENCKRNTLEARMESSSTASLFFRLSVNTRRACRYTLLQLWTSLKQDGWMSAFERHSVLLSQNQSFTRKVGKGDQKRRKIIELICSFFPLVI